LIRQYFVDGFYPTGTKVSGNSVNPKASLIKAVILNGGQKLAGARNSDDSVTSTAMYDVHEAFGRINLLKTLKLNGANTITTLASDEIIRLVRAKPRRECVLLFIIFFNKTTVLGPPQTPTHSPSTLLGARPLIYQLHWCGRTYQLLPAARRAQLTTLI